MGFFGKLLSGASKVGRFIGNVSGAVGNVANALSGIPGIGGVASSVAKAANMVNKVATTATGLVDKTKEIAGSNKSLGEKIADTTKAVVSTVGKEGLQKAANAVQSGVNAMKQAAGNTGQAQRGGGAVSGRPV